MAVIFGMLTPGISLLAANLMCHVRLAYIARLFVASLSDGHFPDSTFRLDAAVCAAWKVVMCTKGGIANEILQLHQSSAGKGLPIEAVLPKELSVFLDVFLSVNEFGLLGVFRSNNKSNPVKAISFTADTHPQPPFP